MAINSVKTHFLLFGLWAISKTNRLLQLPSFREKNNKRKVCSQNHGLVLLLLEFYTISEIGIQDDSGGKICTRSNNIFIFGALK